MARHLLRFNVAHISPVNLILEERLVPELLQDRLTPAAIVAAVEPLLAVDGVAVRTMREGYQRLLLRLGEPGVTRRAAAEILDQMQTAAVVLPADSCI